MSLIWCDIPDRSVGIYGANHTLLTQGLYAQSTVTLVDDPDPNIGAAGKVANFFSGSEDDEVLRFILPGTRTTVGMGGRLFLANIPTETDREPPFHQYRNASNGNLVTIVVSTTGSIQVMRGTSSGTLIAESAQDVIPAQSWRHIESEVFFSATDGTVKVWVEGQLVIDEDTLNTSAAGLPCAQVAWGNEEDNVGGETNVYMKDIFLRDDQGTVNNSQIGPCTVYYRPPSSDISSGWTPSSGTSDYELLDESPPDDAGYISADDSPPAPSIMGMDDLPADVVAIRGIISVARALKTDSGDGNLQVSLSPNGVDWDTGADNAVSTTESYYHDVSELSPATGVAWTPTEFNAARIRLDRTV
jgi:hypothetical protein